MKKTIYLSFNDLPSLQKKAASCSGILNTSIGFINSRLTTGEDGEMKLAKETKALKVDFDPSLCSVSSLLGMLPPSSNPGRVYYEDMLIGVEAETFISQHQESLRDSKVLQMRGFIPTKSDN